MIRRRNRDILVKIWLKCLSVTLSFSFYFGFVGAGFEVSFSLPESSTDYNIMLKEINIHAGAVYVGSETFHAAVYDGPMQVFRTFTRDLNAVLECFRQNGVRIVAMEATGAYWMPLYQTLDRSGGCVRPRAASGCN